MTFVIELLGNQMVIGVAQMLFGKWAKGKEWIPNMVIPILTFIVGVLGYSILPATAQAAGFFAPAAPVLGGAAMLLVQNLLVTGTHSTFKNTVFPVGKWLLGKGAEWILGRVAK